MFELGSGLGSGLGLGLGLGSVSVSVSGLGIGKIVVVLGAVTRLRVFSSAWRQSVEE